MCFFSLSLKLNILPMFMPQRYLFSCITMAAGLTATCGVVLWASVGLQSLEKLTCEVVSRMEVIKSSAGTIHVLNPLSSVLHYSTCLFLAATVGHCNPTWKPTPYALCMIIKVHLL